MKNLLESPDPKEITFDSLNRQWLALVPDIAGLDNDNLAAGDRLTPAIGILQENLMRFKKRCLEEKRKMREERNKSRSKNV